MGVTSGAVGQTLVIGILQGLAAGTLLYIAFYEVLEKEKLSKTGMGGMTGFVFLFLGFAFMAGVQALSKSGKFRKKLPKNGKSTGCLF